MIVCLCRGVSDRTVRLVVAQGARTAEDVAEACGAGNRCGTCVPEVERLIEQTGVAAGAEAGLGVTASGCGGCPLGSGALSSRATTPDVP